MPICQNEACGDEFHGRSDARFCCDACRWRTHSRKAYDMKRKTNMTDIEAVVGAEMAAEIQPKAKKVGGRYAKNKGARIEREVCDILTAKTGEPIKRILGQARDSGADVKWGPFTLEVKGRETVAMPAWQKQVLEAVEGTDQIPAVVWRRKGEKFWIAVPFEEFVDMFHQLRLLAQGQLDKLEAK